MSMFMRLFNTRASKPPSNSAESSGLRFGLPRALARRPGESVPVELVAISGSFTVVGEKMTRADVAPGCTPDAPYALRSRSWFNQFIFGKNGSSLTSHERLNFG